MSFSRIVPILSTEIELPLGVEVVPVEPVEPVPPVLPPVPVGLRGENPMGSTNPVLPPETNPMARSRVRSRFASITITSTTTSALGLSKSWNSFSASAI